MTMRSKQAAAALALLLLAVDRCASAADLHWASSGGGMVSNVADMGWANAFASLGLFNRTDGGANSGADGGEGRGAVSSLGSVSSNSGGTWFTLQFFYSPLFYDAISTSTPEAIRSFVLEYLTAYDTIWPADFEEEASTSTVCDPLKPFAQASPSFQTVLDFCYAAALFDFDWAKYTEALFESTASSYGEDGAALASRPATDANKAPDLSGVPLTLQTSLAANARSTLAGPTGELLMTYVGPVTDDATDGSVFTQPMPLQWVCGSDGDEYWGPAGFLEGLTTYTGYAPASFDINDWSGEFPMFEDAFPPPTDASPLTNLTVDVEEGGAFSPMFGGEPPTVTQIGAASSADALGGGIPSAIAQFYSVVVFTIENSQDLNIVEKSGAKLAAQQAFNALYDVGTSNVNICTDWTPEGDSGCLPNHGRLIDGGYADDTAIASLLSSYQMGPSTPGEDDLLKIIFTYNDDFEDDNTALRYLFSTPENMGDPPGDFFWAPGDRLPHPQRQVFSEFLTSDDIDSLLEAIPDTNMSTAVLKATTVDNPTFGVSAGLSVSILLLKLFPGDLPMFLFSDPSLNVQFADMAHEIASSQVLKERIKDFVGGDADTFGPTGAPVAPQVSSTSAPTGVSATSGAPTMSQVTPTPSPTGMSTTSATTESPTDDKSAPPSSGSFMKVHFSTAAWVSALLLQILCRY